MSNDDSPHEELDVTVPYTTVLDPDAPPLSGLPRFDAEDVRQLGWQAPNLQAVADTINSALNETMPSVAHTVQNTVLRTVRRELDMAPPPVFEMTGLIELLHHDARALHALRQLVAPPQAAPTSTELHALLDRAPSGLAAYLLFLKEAKDLKLSLVDRAALFSKTLSLVGQAARRTQLSELQVYHAQLTAAYTDPVALACLNEPSVTHDHKSVTAVEVLQWIKAYKDARPRGKAPKNAGGGHPGRRPRPRKTGGPPPAKPADKPKTGTSSVKKPTAGKKVQLPLRPPPNYGRGTAWVTLYLGLSSWLQPTSLKASTPAFPLAMIFSPNSRCCFRILPPRHLPTLS